MITSTTSSVEPIPLRRLDSSKYTPSEYTTTETLASTTASLLPSSASAPFIPTTVLQVQALGKAPISFPLPPKDLITPIFSPSTGRPVYLSIRPKRGSGSCVLVDAEDETETPIASTTFWFGPGRNPKVKIGRDDDVNADVFELSGKSLLTRTICFESRKWGKFEWRYADKRERRTVAEGNGSGEINNLLVLDKVVSGNGDQKERVKVAHLVRSEGTRTPGTKASYAGNGGKLEISARDEEGKIVVDEILVVVTCLVMLKKEIDRLRAVQTAVIVGGAGS